MRKHLTLIVLGVLLVALAGALFWMDKNPKKDGSATTPAPDTSISLLNIESDQIKEIHVKNEKTSYGFAHEFKAWKVIGQPNFPTDATKIDSLASSLGKFSASQVIDEKPQDVSVFGLSNPKITAKLVLTDGTTKELIFGNKVPGLSDVYMQIVGDPKVYAAGEFKINDLNSELSSYHVGVNFDIDREKLVYAEVQKGGKSYYTVMKKEAGEKGISVYKMTTPFSRDVDGEDFVKKIVEPAKTIAAQEIIGISDNDSQYGLANPAYRTVLKDEAGKSLTLLFGNEKEGGRYAKIEGAKTVFTVPSDSISFLTIDPEKLVSHFVALENIEDVKEVIIQKGDIKHVLSIFHQEKKENEEAKATYKVDDKDADESKFKAAYQEVIGLSAEGFRAPVISGSPEVTISYKGEKGKPDVTVEFYRTDARTYQVKKNGVAQEDYVLAEKVDKMFKALDDFSKQPK